MTTMKIPIRFGDRIRSKRGSAQHCLIATAARRQWGGDWNALPDSVEHVSDNGQVMRWKPSLGAYLTMFLFDAGLPVPVRSVKLVRGRKMPVQGCILTQPGRNKRTAAEPPAARRARTARRAAAGATGAGVLLLAADGLEWIIYAVAGMLIAVAAAAAIRTVRRHRREGVLPSGSRGAPRSQQHEPGASRAGEAETAAPSFARPDRQGPELDPVQPAAPKAVPVISEAVREAVPVPQEVASARH